MGCDLVYAEQSLRHGFSRIATPDYNGHEFPTAVAFGNTLATAARDGFLCVLGVNSACSASKALERRERRGFAEVAEKNRSEGADGNARASRLP